MSNECKVFEQKAPRMRNAPLRVMPPLAYGTMSSGDTRTLNKSTVMITVQSTLAGTIDFSTATNVDPDGTKSPYSINANQDYDFDVRPGTKIKFT